MGSATSGASGLLFDVEALVVLAGVVTTLFEARGVDDGVATFGVEDTGAGAGVTFAVGADTVGALGVGVATLGVDEAAPAGM
jgi:hypothetical protein